MRCEGNDVDKVQTLPSLQPFCRSGSPTHGILEFGGINCFGIMMRFCQYFSKNSLARSYFRAFPTFAGKIPPTHPSSLHNQGRAGHAQGRGKKLLPARRQMQVYDAEYRVTHLLGKILLLPLTWIWDVPPSCLGSRQLQERPSSCRNFRN